jgi:uncharacterized protein YpiB (UPF0302 family)
MQLKVETDTKGDVAQMVERSLSMREVQGSTPCFSKKKLILTLNVNDRCCDLISNDESQFHVIFSFHKKQR